MILRGGCYDICGKNPEVRLDFTRKERKGFSEVIFCQGKSDSQIAKIAEDVLKSGVDTAFSRMTEEQSR